MSQLIELTWFNFLYGGANRLQSKPRDGENLTQVIGP